MQNFLDVMLLTGAGVISTITRTKRYTGNTGVHSWKPQRTSCYAQSQDNHQGNKQQSNACYHHLPEQDDTRHMAKRGSNMPPSRNT